MNEKKLPDEFLEMAPLVLASALVLGEDAAPVCYAFRTEKDNEYDSGWHFWSGEEDEDYVDDLSNFSVRSLKDFLAKDPTIEEILNHPIGTFWEREPGGAWSQVEYNDSDS